MAPNVTKILVPVDFSDSSKKMLDSALALAGSFGAKVQVLHVIPHPEFIPLDLVTYGKDGERMSLEELALDEAKGHMSEFLGDLGEKVDSRVQFGTPFNAIIETLETGDYDLVAMATHGRTGVSRVFLGSTAERVVRSSPCPVLTMSAHEG